MSQYQIAIIAGSLLQGFFQPQAGERHRKARAPGVFVQASAHRRLAVIQPGQLPFGAAGCVVKCNWPAPMARILSMTIWPATGKLAMDEEYLFWAGRSHMKQNGPAPQEFGRQGNGPPVQFKPGYTTITCPMAGMEFHRITS